MRRIYTYLGKTQTIAQWASEYKIKYGTLWQRLKNGKSIKDALLTPTERAPRTVKVLTPAGELGAHELAKIAGVATPTIYSRRASGWADDELASPRFKHKAITVGGITKTATEWAEAIGVRRQTVYRRIKNGWPPGEVIRPRMSYGQKRTARLVTAMGKTQTIAQWAKERHISAPVIRYRLNKGYPAEVALTAPVEGRRNK